MSKKPGFGWLVLIALGIGWCSNQSDKTSSNTASSRSVQPVSTSSPARPPIPVQPVQNVSITPQAVTPSAPAATTLYTTANVRLRAEPSTSAGVILTVSSGSEVKSTKMDGLWHYVTYRVSPEWSRREDEEKRLAWNDEEGKLRLKKIRPDIIVHRMHTEDNLLVVEAKRVGNTNFEDDIRKLTLMTLDHSADPKFHYGYRLGVHLVVDLPNRNVTQCDVYRNGTIEAELTDLLWRLLH